MLNSLIWRIFKTGLNGNFSTSFWRGFWNIQYWCMVDAPGYHKLNYQLLGPWFVSVFRWFHNWRSCPWLINEFSRFGSFPWNRFPCWSCSPVSTFNSSTFLETRTAHYSVIPALSSPRSSVRTPLYFRCSQFLFSVVVIKGLDHKALFGRYGSSEKYTTSFGLWAEFHYTQHVTPIKKGGQRPPSLQFV